LSGSLPSLSRLLKRWAPSSGPLGCLVWSLGAPWASGTRGSCGGDPWVAAVFPRLTPALEFADLGADYGADAEGTNVDQPRSGGFQDQVRMSLFVWPCGVFWASGACGSVLGYHGQPLCFHGLSLILGFFSPLNLDSVLVLSACGWRVWQVAPVFPLCGGLLALFRVQFLCHIFIRFRGSLR
jgi:hypothetical protein